MRTAPAWGKVCVSLAIVYVVWGTTHYATLLAVQTLPAFFMTGSPVSP
jgi:hypothetical protein